MAEVWQRTLTEAVNWYRRGAEAGNADAMASLGVMLANGRGVSQNVAEAVNWYRRSAEAGNASAMNSLGNNARTWPWCIAERHRGS
jgi:TPR repeat protein